MMTTTVAEEFRSDFMRELAAHFRAEGRAQGRTEGRTEGRAEGEARAILNVLAARGVRITRKVRDEILACDDPVRLEKWAREAAVASSINDLTHG